MSSATGCPARTSPIAVPGRRAETISGPLSSVTTGLCTLPSLMLSPAAAETALIVPGRVRDAIEVAFRAISSWATVALAAASRCSRLVQRHADTVRPERGH